MAKAKDSPVPVAPLFAAAVPPDAPGAPAAPEGTQPPPFGTPKVADVRGEFPRVCQQLERVPAGSGLNRYKVRTRNYAGFNESLYILARDEDSATGCYLEASAIKSHLDQLRKSKVKEADLEEPQFVVTELDD